MYGYQGYSQNSNLAAIRLEDLKEIYLYPDKIDVKNENFEMKEYLRKAMAELKGEELARFYEENEQRIPEMPWFGW